MLNPAIDTSTLLGDIQKSAADRLYVDTFIVEELIGKDAVYDLLKDLLLTVLGLAIGAVGKENACQLMGAALITGQKYTPSEDDGC